jgi:carbon storage regulator
MLILTRRPGESVMVGNDIDVVVLGVDGQQVRIGIKAPHGVLILRDELAAESPTARGSGGDASTER